MNPRPEPSLDESDISKAIELWSNLVHSPAVKFINVDMHSSTSFVYCKATFHQNDSDAIGVEIWLRYYTEARRIKSYLEQPMILSKNQLNTCYFPATNFQPI